MDHAKDKVTYMARTFLNDFISALTEIGRNAIDLIQDAWLPLLGSAIILGSILAATVGSAQG